MRRIKFGKLIVMLALASFFSFSACGKSKKDAELARCMVNKDAPIGGEFELVDHQGSPFSKDNMKDQYSLLYFGFTHCPDVCPLSVVLMRAAIDQLPEDVAEQYQPIFITLDPERDGTGQLARYVDNDAFPKGLIGLTGSLEQIKQAAAQFKIGFQKVPLQESKADYVIDHSSYIMAFDPQAQFLGMFTHGVAADEIAACLRHYVD